jgi:UDP-glucose 4-epimerase
LGGVFFFFLWLGLLVGVVVWGVGVLVFFFFFLFFLFFPPLVFFFFGGGRPAPPPFLLPPPPPGGALYGDFVTPPNIEDYPKDPESPYGIAKLSAELYLAYYARVHRVDTVALRYANVYGPRQDPHGEAGVVAIFCNRILTRQPLTVFGDGSQTRDYVFVKDVARANLAAATVDLPAPGKLDARGFNIGTGVETSVVALAAALQKSAGSNVAVHYAPARPGEQQRSAVSIAKAGRQLGWKPTVALHDGLEETFSFFAERFGRERQLT